MPFTPAHVAAVLPLRGRYGLPFAALAAGSMSPDLLYYLPGGRGSVVPATHSLWGILTWDLLFGLLMWVAWCWAARPLWELAPDLLRARWRQPAAGLAGWRLAPLAVLIGAAGHVLWDEFTHAGRFGATWVPALSAVYPSPVGPLEGYRWLQYASGVLGLAALLWAFLRVARTEPPPRSVPWLARLAPIVVIAAGAVAGGMRWASVGLQDWRTMAFELLTSSIGGAIAAVTVLCAGFAVLTQRKPLRPTGVSRARGWPRAVSLRDDEP